MYYLVYYSCGEYDDYHKIDLFITMSEEYALKYSEKFNKKLSVWKEYYNQYADGYGCWKGDDDKIFLFNRFYQITDINSCMYKQIDFRLGENI